MKASTEQQQLKIPIQVFLDVCKMIRAGNINNKIIGSNEALGEVLMDIFITKGNKIQNSALQNIYDTVNEWNEQRYGDESPDEIALN
jgi:hypothetical protein